MRVGVIGESLCLLMPSMSSDIGGFGEFGELIAIVRYMLVKMYL